MQIHILRTLVISSATVFSFLLTLFLPANTVDLESAQWASLIFLPHGIRVIAAWMYGWQSLLYLLPAHVYLHWARIDIVEAEWSALLMPVFGIICVPLVFEIAARLGTDMRLSAGYTTNWRNVLAVGCAASLVNAIGTNAIAGNSVEIMVVYLIGDIVGMIVLIILAMLFFRFLRKAGL